MSISSNSKRPLKTCEENACEYCDINQSLNCHTSTLKSFGIIVGVLLILVIGFRGLPDLFSKFHQANIILMAFILIYVYFIRKFVLCVHCPHYQEQAIKNKIDINKNKIRKYRPGPMSIVEKCFFLGGLLIIIVYPVPFMILQGKWINLALYAAALIIGVQLFRHCMCTKCINFGCPLNKVDKETREQFFSHNPAIKEAWKNQ